MSYREKVRDRVQNLDRADERKRLWDEICSAYEDGGAEQVESTIAGKIDGLQTRFDAVIEKLQQVL